MIIHIINKQKALKISSDAVKKVVELVIKGEKQTCDEVSIYFVSTKKICQLHEEFFGDPKTTDCISFPMDGETEEYRVLGEVFVCPETAIAYGLEHGMDPYEELTLYIIHGLLHLMEYDDIQSEDRQKIRKAENRHRNKIKKLNYRLKP